MTINSLFHSIGHMLASVFSHQEIIQTAVTDARLAATAAAEIATVTGHADAVPLINKLNDGLGIVGNAALKEASAQTLNDHAQILGGLATDILPDIGVKNADLQAAVKTAVVRTQSVVGALTTAAQAAEAAGNTGATGAAAAS